MAQRLIRTSQTWRTLNVDDACRFCCRLPGCRYMRGSSVRRTSGTHSPIHLQSNNVPRCTAVGYGDGEITEQDEEEFRQIIGPGGKSSALSDRRCTLLQDAKSGCRGRRREASARKPENAEEHVRDITSAPSASHHYGLLTENVAAEHLAVRSAVALFLYLRNIKCPQQ